LSRGDIIRALKERGQHARVAEAMTKELPSISYRQPLEDAFRLLQEKSAPAVVVLDAGGRLAGMVTSETIGEMMMLREALPKDAAFGPWGPVAKT
jgi:stage IV sporulation protein FB